MGALDGRVAFITGGARGQGRAHALALAAEGASVVVADAPRPMNLTYPLGTEDDLRETVKLVEELGGVCHPIVMDVRDANAVSAAFDETVGKFGSLNILVSNAGIQIVHPLEQFPLADWKRLLAVHLDGAFLTTRACLRHMYARGQGGTIIYMGSVHSKEASPLKGPYVTAKHGLLGLAKVVAKEGATHGVRANVICPGFVRTPLVDKQIPEQARTLGISEQEVIRNVMLKETVDGEFTTVEDVTEATLFCATFPSNALTGQSVIVSHGWFMQ